MDRLCPRLLGQDGDLPGPLIFPVSNSNTEKSVGVKGGGGRGDFSLRPLLGEVRERQGLSSNQDKVSQRW